MNSSLALLLAALAALAQQPTLPPPSAPVRPPGTLPENAPRPEFWVTNGGCTAAALDDATLYIGGLFSHVGPFTGPFAVVGSETGDLEATRAKIEGPVHCVVGDNLGGWYVGGDFTRVGTRNQGYLAHLLPSGDVDFHFTPQVDGHVTALRLAQGWLYVAGPYTHIGGQAIPTLARIDAATGSADANWHPLQGSLGSQDTISGLVINGSTLFAFGYFDSPSVLPRRHIAAFDLGSAVLLPWAPQPDSSVFDLVVAGTSVYVGGNFTTIAGAPRNRLAALDRSTGAALAFNPNANSTVFCIGLSGTTLYAGGYFTTLGGQTRGRGGAVDVSSGNVLAWNPQIAGTSQHELDDLLIRNGSVYVGGKFSSAGGQPRWNLAKLDGQSGAATNWRVDVAGPDTPVVERMANQGPLLALAGTFRTVGGDARESLAALDRQTGQLLPRWHPSVLNALGAPDPGVVHAILLTDTGLYVGGSFAAIDDLARPNLALLDKQTGMPIAAFRTNAINGFVNKLLFEGQRLYCGGSFSSGSSGPNSLAVLDPYKGMLLAPTLSVAGTVYDMDFSPDHSKLYVCGQFSWAGSPPVARNSVACMDVKSGAVLPWYPLLGSGIATGLDATANGVYLAGTFFSIAGQSRTGLARVDTLNGSPQTWAPLLQGGTPGCVLVFGTKVLIGGGFNSVNLLWQPHAAALGSLAPGALQDWYPESAGCSSYVTDGTELVALGSFRFRDGSQRPNFAVFRMR